MTIHAVVNPHSRVKMGNTLACLASAETRALLERWGRLHAVRSVLSVLASVAYVLGLVGA